MFGAFFQLIARVRGFFARGSDFDDELGAHLEMLTADYVKDGMSPKEARRAALVRLGGIAQLREAHREASGLPFLETLLQDLRYALRALRKNPSFTALAVLTLSIGIGVNTAVFTAYNAAVLRPVQAADPDRLVQLTRDTREQLFSYPDYVFYRENARSFRGLDAAKFDSVSIAGVDIPAPTAKAGIAAVAGFAFPQVVPGSSERVGAAIVPADFFGTLGINAAYGRVFVPEDDAPGAPPAVMISENFWERRFSRDPGLLGRTLAVDGIAFTVVGVTRRDDPTVLPLVPNLWIPLGQHVRLMSNPAFATDHSALCCRLFARLRDGVSHTQAEAELNAIDARLAAAHPIPDLATAPRGRMLLPKASPNGPPDGNTTLLAVLVLAAVSLVLMIACANVASLLLARSAARQREIAIRLAIGAGRGRLVRQLLTENAVISLMAGMAGILFSWWALHLLMVQIAASLPPEYGAIALNVTPDHRVLGYMLFLATTATLACGLAPALEASRPNLTSALRDEGAAFGGGIRKSRLRALMVGAQVAVCLVLMIGAAMLARTSQRALAVDIGFDYRKILTLYVDLPNATRAATEAARLQLARELSGLPEVESIAVAQRMPLAGGLRSIAVSLHGEPFTSRGNPNALYNLVTPGFFDTLGIPIVRGRNFVPHELRDGFDFDGSPVIVSERTARRFWPGEDPIGKRFAFGRGLSRHFSGESVPHSASAVVIGVTKDVRSADLYRVDATCLYLPVDLSWGGTIAMRVRGDEGMAAAAVERLVRSSHRDAGAWVADSRAAYSNQAAFVAARISAIAAGIIGLFGLLMASVGIHGTVGFAVTQRTQEIGIRMALGSSRGAVLRLVLWDTMRPVAIGLAVGFTLSAILARLVSSFLFGLSALDPAAFAGGSAFLAITALTAGYLPARRATRVDPAIALRYE